MITSKTIKAKQYQPIKGTRNGNRWTFQSESRDRVEYTVSRDGTEYKCGCPARGLCKHITSAVLSDAKIKFEVVQVWTSEEDADRQHRRKLEMSVNGTPFWVTYEARNPLKNVVRFCRTWGGADTVDLFYRNADNTDRCEIVNMDYDELEQIAKRLGWTQRGCYWFAT